MATKQSKVKKNTRFISFSLYDGEFEFVDFHDYEQDAKECGDYYIAVNLPVETASSQGKKIGEVTL